MDRPDVNHPRNESLITLTYQKEKNKEIVLTMMFNGSFLNAGFNFFLVMDGKVVADEGMTGWHSEVGCRKRMTSIISNILQWD